MHPFLPSLALSLTVNVCSPSGSLSSRSKSVAQLPTRPTSTPRSELEPLAAVPVLPHADAASPIPPAEAALMMSVMVTSS